jgi:hypothetical protein
MPYEDFHELFYQAYMQATTDEGQKQQEADLIEEEFEEMIPPQYYGSADMGIAIKNAIEAEKNKPKPNKPPRR